MSSVSWVLFVEKCPVCRRFTHADACPLRGSMALEWSGIHPDDRAREAHK